jgi:hypothetical protein
MGSGCATVTRGLAAQASGQFQVLLYPGPGVSDHGSVTIYDRLLYPGSHPSVTLTSGETQPPYAGGRFTASPLPDFISLRASYCNDAEGQADMPGGVVGQPGPQVMIFWKLPKGQQLVPGYVYSIFGQLPPKLFDPSFITN